MHKKNQQNFVLLVCRDDWIRTSDHTHPMRVRYQTAPHPEKGLQKYKFWQQLNIDCLKLLSFSLSSIIGITLSDFSRKSNQFKINTMEFHQTSTNQYGTSYLDDVRHCTVYMINLISYI